MRAGRFHDNLCIALLTRHSCNYHGVCKFYEDNAIIDNGTYLKQEVNYIDGVIDWQKCYDESGNKIPCD